MATTKPAYLDTIKDKDEVEGFKKPESTGIKLLAIVGADDDILDPNNQNYIEGAEAGNFVIKASNMVVTTPVKVIPVEYNQLFAEFEPNRGEFIRYISLEDGRKICKDPYKFGAKETIHGKTLQEAYTFIVVLPDYDNILCMISFMSSRVPDGEAWFRTIMSRRIEGQLIAPWNQVYMINTMRTQNTKGKWYLIKAKFDRFVTEQEHTMVSDVKSSYSSFNPVMLEDNTGGDY